MSSGSQIKAAQCVRGRVCEFQKSPGTDWEVEKSFAAISEIRTPDPAFNAKCCAAAHSERNEGVDCWRWSQRRTASVTALRVTPPNAEATSSSE